jgi:hypothetical protein
MIESAFTFRFTNSTPPGDFSRLAMFDAMPTLMIVTL